MSRLLFRVGGFCAKHRFAVLAVWVAILAATVVGGGVVGLASSDDLTLPGTDATEATDILNDYLPKQAYGTNPVVLQATSGKLTDSANSKAVKDTVDSLGKNQYVQDAVSPLSEDGAGQLSKDETIGYISVTLTLSSSDLDEDEANEIIAATDPATNAGLTVAVGGYLGQEVSTPSTHSSEAIGILAAIVILLFTFGTVSAMAVPIISAIFGVVISLRMIDLLSHVMDVPSVAPTIATMIGLGVGIDYALFIVTRHRQRLADGLPPDEAAARACATSGSAVAFAGGTVVIALCSLAVANIPLIRALGFTAAVAVLTAVLIAITLIPALLAILGERIESLRVLDRHPHADLKPRGWERWARGVAKRPWPALIVSVLILGALAAPILGLTLGQEDDGQMPTDTQERQAYDLLTEGFGSGVNGPLLIASTLDPPAHNDQNKLNQLKQQENQQQQQQQQAVEQTTEQLEAEGVPADQAQQEAEQQVAAQGPSEKQQQEEAQQEQYLKSTASDPRLVHLENQIAKQEDVKSVSLAQVDKSGNAAVFTVIATSAPSDQRTEDLINNLRDNVIPEANAGSGVVTHVDGQTAGYMDLATEISDKLPLVIITVVALSFVLLTLAFRTVVVPATAAVMNLLSVAAAYGVLTLVFEDGFGLSLIGLDHEAPVVSYVPLLMFAILFGLSMDYQVFLVSRIGEVWTKTNDNYESVIEGLTGSARVITSAALIMVCVFGSFVFNGDPVVKQFGLGMAVAIAVDATIVRCLLVPAVMVLLGKANWYLPSWLDRFIPNLGMESEDELPEPASSK